MLPGSPKSTRLETRCPGADVNPYLAVAAVLAAGLHGIEGLKLDRRRRSRAPTRAAERAARAAHADRDHARFQQSKVARDWFGDAFVDHFAATREWEWAQWLDAVTDWELKRYFEII